MKCLNELFRRRQFGVKLTLDSMRSICAALGHPEAKLNFIHIAGTNGKGSVAAMSSAILKNAGLKVGLYTSPHLIRYHERFRFNEVDISNEDLERLLERVLPISSNATFFEVSTAVALCWFRELSCDVVVWETGLGGRLDATNVVTPRVSVITQIGLDHQQYLGETLSQIAAEKAGIMKPNLPAITIEQDEKVMSVLKNRSAEIEAPLQIVKVNDFARWKPPIPGTHQKKNMAMAIAACRIILPSISDEMVEQGLSRTRWPGRCQYIQREPCKLPILIDGAHNEIGAKVIASEVASNWGGKKVTLIFGILGDKDIAEFVNVLEPFAATVILVPVKNDRSAKVEDLALQFHIPKKIATNLIQALKIADDLGNPILITGSLYLVGEALTILQGDENQANHPNESFRPKQ